MCKENVPKTDLQEQYMESSQWVDIFSCRVAPQSSMSVGPLHRLQKTPACKVGNGGASTSVSMGSSFTTNCKH